MLQFLQYGFNLKLAIPFVIARKWRGGKFEMKITFVVNHSPLFSAKIC